MANVTFDDLIPGPQAGSGGLSFNDLVPPQARGDTQGRADRSAREADLTKAQTEAAYGEMAKGVRDRQGTFAKYADTAARGLARAIPVMDDIAAFGDTVTGGGMGGTFSERYADNLMRQRAMNQVDDTQRPVTSYGTQIAGAVAALPTFGVAANSIRGGAALGAGYGAAYGFGAGDSLADRAQRAGAGALIGGAVGGAVPAAVNMFSGAASGARTAAGPIIGAISPEGEAARRIQRAIEIDARSGSAGLSRAEMEALQRQGVPTAVADLGGDATRALARASANVSPEAKTALDAVVNPRFASQTERVSDVIGRTSTLGANAPETLDALQAAARKANATRYNAAYAQGEAGVWNDGLSQLLEAPAVQDALRKTLKNAGNRSVVEGSRPIRSPFAMQDDMIVLARQADGSIPSPNLQFWDDMKRHLDDAYRAANKNGQANLANDIQALKRQLVDNLDSVIPAYKEARQGASAAFGAEDALDAGQKFLTAAGQNAEYAKAIAKMSEPERALFQEGFASALRAKVAEIGDRRTVLDKIANSPAARQRIEMALGKANAEKIMAQLRIEGVLDRLRPAVQGNSTTTAQLIQLGLVAAPAGAGGGLGFLAGGDSNSAIAGAMAGGLARWGKGKVDEKIARKVGEMLASSDPKVIDRALAMVAKSQALQKTISDFDAALVKAGLAPTAGAASERGASFLSGMNPSRADAQQEKQN